MPLELTPKTPPYYTIETNINKIYKAIITQSGTNNPTATENSTNTLTGIVWTRSGVGIYLGTLTAAFPAGETYITTTINSGNVGILYANRSTDNVITLSTWGVNGIAQDNIIQTMQIEIITY